MSFFFKKKYEFYDKENKINPEKIIFGKYQIIKLKKKLLLIVIF